MVDTKKPLRDPVRKYEPRPRQIIFSFTEGVSALTKNATLKKIRLWKEVASAERVFQGTDMEMSSHLLNLYAVYVHKEKQLDSVLRRLQSLPEIERAYLPPSRRIR